MVIMEAKGLIPDVNSVNKMAGEHLYRAIHARNDAKYELADRRIDRAITACESIMGPDDWKVREKLCSVREIVLLEVKAWWHMPTSPKNVL